MLFLLNSTKLSTDLQIYEWQIPFVQISVYNTLFFNKMGVRNFNKLYYVDNITLLAEKVKSSAGSSNESQRATGKIKNKK